MCDWGTEAQVEVTVPAHLSHTGEPYRKLVGIDACIAPIVKALNAGGIATIGSCCGHKKGPGEILLADDGNSIVVTDPDDELDRLLIAWLDHCQRQGRHVRWRGDALDAIHAYVDQLRDGKRHRSDIARGRDLIEAIQNDDSERVGRILRGVPHRLECLVPHTGEG